MLSGSRGVYTAIFLSILAHFLFLSILFPRAPTARNELGGGQIVRFVIQNTESREITKKNEKFFKSNTSGTISNSQQKPPAITQKASVVGEWFLNLENWPLGTRKKFVLKVWISAQGHITSWEIVGKSVDDEMIRSATEDIFRTVMNPAYSGETPVDSQLTVEIDVSRDD